MAGSSGWVVRFGSEAVDFGFVHRYLAQLSYWARGIPVPILRTAIENSLCASIFEGEVQIGFARVVTDRATFAYLCDVFVDGAYRGRGASTQLLDALFDHSDLKSVRRMLLVTSSAHAIYEKYGFAPPSTPENLMEFHRPDVYSTGISN